MSGKNIEYKTNQIADYFSVNRTKWDQFYPSEKWIFERVAGPEGQMGSVLDAGCAAGGLGLALEERFSLKEYVGVDINIPAIKHADLNRLKYACPCHFISGDILSIDSLPNDTFDKVFSLSCADWNMETEDIISKCWKYVRVGGHFVLTLRLTPQHSLLDFSDSFQYIYFGEGMPENEADVEKAPYIVLNVQCALAILENLQPKPDHVMAYGYWEKPSPIARTRYDRIVFTALAVRKGNNDGQDIPGEFHLPVDLFLQK